MTQTPVVWAVLHGLVWYQIITNKFEGGTRIIVTSMFSNICCIVVSCNNVEVMTIFKRAGPLFLLLFIPLPGWDFNLYIILCSNWLCIFQALLHSVPVGKMIVLDLFAEVLPIWTTSEQFYGVPYIWQVNAPFILIYQLLVLQRSHSTVTSFLIVRNLFFFIIEQNRNTKLSKTWFIELSVLIFASYPIELVYCSGVCYTILLQMLKCMGCWML